GSLHEEIWLRRPPGFTGSFPPGTQWSLRRPVYGLRQAPREWHDTRRTTLAALVFAPSTADPSLFLRTDTSLPQFYVLVYVDDLVFVTADTAGLAHVKSELQKRHTCTDLGELRSYLGLQITRDRAQRTITLIQSHMVQQVLQRFDFTYSSPQATPLSTRHSLSALPSDESVESSGPYPELVGCLMYLMTCTRPDLAYPLSILARYVAPGRHRPEHMAAAKRVLRYLCSTSGMGLVLGGRRPLALLCLTGLVTSCSPPLCLWGCSATSSLRADSPSHSSARPSPPSPCPQVHTVATRSGLPGGSATRGSCRHAEQLVGAAATSAFQRLRPAQKPQTPRSLTFPLYLGPRSPPGYYFRPGAAAGRLRWHIYLPGGAWCVTPADCSARAGTRLGSSKSFPANPAHYAAQLRPPFEGILSGSAQQNPAMYQWNLVRLIYCDGGGYAGTRGALNVSAAPAPPNASAAANSTSPSNSTKSTGSTKSSASTTSAIYLDGWNIIQAVIQDLVQKHEMRSASQILLSGSSAGGQATVNLCDWLASSFPSASTRCLVDSGFFLDTRDRAMNYTFRSLAQNLTALHQPSNPTCPHAARPAQQWRCFFPQYTLHNTSTPLFFFHTPFDYVAAMIA
ncbi:unnamed protein product, partial [Closterium sp. NIES-53]